MHDWAAGSLLPGGITLRACATSTVTSVQRQNGVIPLATLSEQEMPKPVPYNGRGRRSEKKGVVFQR